MAHCRPTRHNPRPLAPDVLGDEEKTCPKCGKIHFRANSRFCSLKCSKSRVHTQADKDLRSKKLKEWWNNTEEGQLTKIVKREAINNYNETKNPAAFRTGEIDFDYNIPDDKILDDYLEIFEGYEVAADW